jgi:RNA polymerase sigma factor (sigma-70 family)
MKPTPEPTAIGTDPDALEAFYREHVAAVQRFVARRVADPERAADLTADIFLAALDAAGSYRPARGAPVAWLFGIARHVVADDARHRARELRAVSRLGGRRPLQPDALARARERIDAEREARRLYAALHRLPAGQRAVFELVALDGLDLQEAARALGLQPVTARVRLHRARRTMQTQLGLAGPASPQAPNAGVDADAPPARPTSPQEALS